MLLLCLVRCYDITVVGSGPKALDSADFIATIRPKIGYEFLVLRGEWTGSGVEVEDA